MENPGLVVELLFVDSWYRILTAPAMFAVGRKIHLLSGVKAVFREVLRGSLAYLMYWGNLKLKLRLLNDAYVAKKRYRGAPGGCY